MAYNSKRKRTDQRSRQKSTNFYGQPVFKDIFSSGESNNSTKKTLISIPDETETAFSKLLSDPKIAAAAKKILRSRAVYSKGATGLSSEPSDEAAFDEGNDIVLNVGSQSPKRGIKTRVKVNVPTGDDVVKYLASLSDNAIARLIQGYIRKANTLAAKRHFKKLVLNKKGPLGISTQPEQIGNERKRKRGGSKPSPKSSDYKPKYYRSVKADSKGPTGGPKKD